MTLKKVKRVRLFEQAVDQLQELILSGSYEPGDKLPTEQELCDLLGVSRSSVREAMRVLEAEGLINVRRGSGSYVSPPQDWATSRGEVLRWLAQRQETVIQILQVRRSIEGLTAELTAEGGLSESLAGTLSDIVQEQEALMERDGDGEIDRLAKLDVKFHVTISEASGNDMAHEIVSHVIPAFSEANKALLWMSQGAKKAISEHRIILKAIQSGEPETAKAAMQDHIDRVRIDLVENIEEL